MNIEQIVQKSEDLRNKVTQPGYTATARDVAEAQELMSKYIDELERLENNVVVKPFLSSDVVADKILKWWYPNE